MSLLFNTCLTILHHGVSYFAIVCVNFIFAMPSVRINVYRTSSMSRSRSTGGRRSRSIRRRSRSIRRRRDRSTTRRSVSRRRRRHRRNDEPSRGWVGTQEPPRIWRGASLMPSSVRNDEPRHSERFLVSILILDVLLGLLVVIQCFGLVPKRTSTDYQCTRSSSSTSTPFAFSSSTTTCIKQYWVTANCTNY